MKYKSTLLPYIETKETKAYAAAISKGRYSQFVIPDKDGWKVKNHDIDQKLPEFSKKSEAIAAAKALAAKRNAEVFVFDSNGTITERFLAAS